MAPSHHRRNGFQNNGVPFQPKGLGEVLRWRWQAWRDHAPRPPTEPIPQATPDLPFLHAQARAGRDQQPSVTWIGHATALVQLGGLTLLTDPVFSERASPFSFAGPKRHQPPGIALDALPHIDVVVVSHNHYDHLDAPSVRALAAQAGGAPVFVVPLGLAAWFASHGIAGAVELDWWHTHRVDSPHGGADVVLVPAYHWSARGIADRMATLWGGFAVLADNFHLFFAGDTGYSRDFADIRAHFAERQTAARGGGFDLALLPIGAYAPRWFMSNQHVDVPEALQIHRDLGTKRSLGVHWGTFELTDEPLDEPPRELARLRPGAGIADEDFFVMAIGETRRLPKRVAAHIVGNAPPNGGPSSSHHANAR